MTDIDVCERQLELAKEGIRNYQQKIKDMADETAQKEAEAKAAEDDYNEKNDLYQQAVNTFNNYKTDQSYKETLPGSNEGCHTNWTDEACQRNCTSDKKGKFSGFGGVPGGANIGYEWDNCYQDCCAYKNNRVCVCKMPNLNIFAANGRALETAKTIMDQAERDKIDKRRTATEYAQRPVPSPEINIACCTNSVTCGTDSDCNKITQTCESKIDAMKSEKVESEKVESEKKATDNPSTQTGQKSTSSVNSPKTNLSSNIPISSSIVCFCCFLIIIVIIFFFIMKSNERN
jgi:hypothetical protein